MELDGGYQQRVLARFCREEHTGSDVTPVRYGTPCLGRLRMYPYTP